MRGVPIAAAAWLMSMGCSDAASEDDDEPPAASSEAASGGAGRAAGGSTPGGNTPGGSTPGGNTPGGTPGPTTETLPLMQGQPAMVPAGSADEAASASPYVTFTEPATGFSTEEVHDADREIVRFDATLAAMVSAASGDSVGGWTVKDAELDWARSGVAFRVRFGTEEGERRAFFTEAGPGTICNLNIVGPDVLFISATSETPPNP